MKSPASRIILSLAVLASALGCTKGIPEVTVGDKLPAIEMDPDGATSTKLTSLVVNDGEGLCPPEVIRINIRFDDGPWMDLKEIDPAAVIDCANVGTGTKGPFRFAIDLNSAQFSAVKTKLLSGGSVVVQGRGFSDLMMTEDGQITVSLDAAGTPSKIVLAAVRRQACTSGCQTPSTRLLSGQVNFQAPSSGVFLNPGNGRILMGIVRSASE